MMVILAFIVTQSCSFSWWLKKSESFLGRNRIWHFALLLKSKHLHRKLKSKVTVCTGS